MLDPEVSLTRTELNQPVSKTTTTCVCAVVSSTCVTLRNNTDAAQQVDAMGCDRLIVETDDTERDDRALVEQRRTDSNSEHKRDDSDNDDAVVSARAWSPAAAIAPASAPAARAIAAEHDDFSDDTDLEEGASCAHALVVLFHSYTDAPSALALAQR